MSKFAATPGSTANTLRLRNTGSGTTIRPARARPPSPLDCGSPCWVVALRLAMAAFRGCVAIVWASTAKPIKFLLLGRREVDRFVMQMKRAHELFQLVFLDDHRPAKTIASSTAF